VRASVDRPIDISRAAAAIGPSRRSLERRTHAAVSMTPLEIAHRIRMERAAHLERTTSLSTGTIARKVGYANIESLRALRRRASDADRR
jgi:transcriptional regulator GlxA family with amidase domain